MSEGGAPTGEPPSSHRPTTILLLDHPNLDLGAYVRVQPDWYAEDTEGLDRVVQVDLALLDLNPLGLELVRDIGGRDRTEELSLLADARRKGERNLLYPRGEVLRGIAAVALGRLESLPFGGDSLEVTGRGLVGEASREEVVAGVAGLHVHHVARVAEVFDG